MTEAMPNLKRRKLISGLSILGFGSLTGCIPLAQNGLVRGNSVFNGPIEDTYKSLMFSNQTYQSALGSYDPVLSNKSQAIFKSILTNGVIPQYLSLPTENQADEVINLFNTVKDKYAGKKNLELSETYEVMQHLIPLTRMFVDVNSVNTSSKSKPSNESVSVSSDGTLSIPPGYHVVSIQQGYCLDQPLPAPGREDKLTITPSSNLIPKELMPLYRSMQDKAYNDKDYLDQMQKLMWTLRAAGQPNSLATHVDAETLRNMNKAMPNGAQTFIDYHNKMVGGNGIVNLAQRKAAQNQGDPNGNVGQKMFNSFMAGLTGNNNNQVGGVDSSPNDNRNYQMLNPNVASFSIGNKPLKPQIEIVNTGNDTFRINLADYVMSPSKKQQRVSMYPTKPENISFFKYGMAPDPAQLVMLQKLKDKLNPALLSEAARFMNDKFLKNISRSETFRNFAFRLIKESPATKMILGSLPILGNALSAYEAISGKNWVNGRDLNAFERTAAAFGTIPGGGILGTVFRERLVTVAGTIFAGAGFAVNQGLMQKDVAAYSQAYTNPISFVSEFGSDAIKSNLNKSFVELAKDTSFTKTERASMLRYAGTPGPNQY